MDATLGFLKLCGDHPDEAFTPSGKIDIGWHAFLLYTTNYTVFFHQVARRFIHHEPNDDPSAQITARDVTSTVAFMQDHGIKFDPEMWAVPPPESAVSPPAVSAFRSDGLTRRDWGGCQTCWGS